MYLIRLDDASEYMNVEKWDRLESLLDKYGVKPIVGIIPDNQDIALIGNYQKDLGFWNKASTWILKGWAIALHGYTHAYSSSNGGINPVNFRSEFAGLTLDKQREKIRGGIQVFKERQIVPKIFFAPYHTFDTNTIEALKLESNIRIISDTVANDIYKMGDFYFIPQQSGRARKLPFKVVTFCYHPNTMSENDFMNLATFIEKNKSQFITFNDLVLKDRNLDFYDRVLRHLYFLLITIKRKMVLWRN